MVVVVSVCPNHGEVMFGEGVFEGNVEGGGGGGVPCPAEVSDVDDGVDVVGGGVGDGFLHVGGVAVPVAADE